MGFLLAYGWWAIVIAGILALLLLDFVIYLLVRIFTDSDTASLIASACLLCPIGIVVGCCCPGIILGVLTLAMFDSFVAGVVIGGMVGLIVSILLVRER